jgi:hypothetical protein
MLPALVALSAATHSLDLTRIGHISLTTGLPVVCTLNYSLTTVFIFATHTSDFEILVKTLDMTDWGTIVPDSIGFTAFFLTEVLIQGDDTATLDIYVLDRTFCYGNIFVYTSTDRQSARVTWSSLHRKYFDCCFLQRAFSESPVRITARVESSESRTVARFSDSWTSGTFVGTAVGEPIALTPNMIVALHGVPSASESLFVLETLDVTHQLGAESFVDLPYYFLVMPDGLNFTEDLGLQHTNVPVSPRFSPPAIAGLVISIVAMLAILVVAAQYWGQACRKSDDRRQRQQTKLFQDERNFT